MATYRKKPVEIEAVLLNERGLIGEDWFWDAVTKNDIITHCFSKHEPAPAWCEIKTLEGVMVARAGDYIIRGIHGEIYPCKADVFEKTYTECKSQTNADRIRAMSDEELARTFTNFFVAVTEANDIPVVLDDNFELDHLEFLKQPAKEVSNDTT